MTHGTIGLRVSWGFQSEVEKKEKVGDQWYRIIEEERDPRP